MSCDTLSLLFNRGKQRIKEYDLAWVGDFSKLHDHIDANAITSIDDDFAWEPGIMDWDDEEGFTDFGFLNAAHDAIHAWLEHLADPIVLHLEG